MNPNVFFEAGLIGLGTALLVYSTRKNIVNLWEDEAVAEPYAVQPPEGYVAPRGFIDLKTGRRVDIDPVTRKEYFLN